MELKVPHVHEVRAKGRTYYYHRVTRERLPDDPIERAKRVLEINDQAEEPDTVRIGTMADLITCYKISPKFTKRAPRTKKDYQKHMDFLGAHFGGLPVREWDFEKVERLQRKLANTPRTADYLVQVLSILLNYAIRRPKRFGLKINPCDAVEKMYDGGEGYPPWPDNVIQKAIEHAYPELANLIVTGLYTGQRSPDDIALTWNHYDGRGLYVIQQKTGTRLWIPAHHILKSLFDSMEKRAAVILTTQTGRPWTQSNVQHEIMNLMEEIGFKGYSRHGLRKNAVNNLLEAGCTEYEVSAITGQSPQMVAHYAKRVNQKKLAESAIRKLTEHGRGTDVG